MKRPSPSLRRLLAWLVENPRTRTDDAIAACREYGIKVPKDEEDGA